MFVSLTVRHSNQIVNAPVSVNDGKENLASITLITRVTLAQLKRQFNDDRSLCSTLLIALVDHNFNGPMSNSEQTIEQY